MQWNLISYSEATESISCNQLIWENNHLKLFFPKYKSDQIDRNKEEARHVYLNPKNSAVCPIQALASYLLAFLEILNKLFAGNDQKKDSTGVCIGSYIPILTYTKHYLLTQIKLDLIPYAKVLQHITVQVYILDHL